MELVLEFVRDLIQEIVPFWTVRHYEMHRQGNGRGAQRPNVQIMDIADVRQSPQTALTERDEDANPRISGSPA